MMASAEEFIKSIRIGLTEIEQCSDYSIWNYALQEIDTLVWALVDEAIPHKPVQNKGVW